MTPLPRQDQAYRDNQRGACAFVVMMFVVFGTMLGAPFYHVLTRHGERAGFDFVWPALRWGLLLASPLMAWLAIKAMLRWCRRRAMAHAAAEAGYHFVGTADRATLAYYRDFSMFKDFSWWDERTGKRISNLCYQQFDDIYVALFDYQYYEPGSGDGGGHTERNSLLHIHSEQFEFGELRIRGRGVVDKIAKFLNKDVGFPEYPAFAENYYVYGSDAALIRSLIDERVADFFASLDPKPVIEAHGQDLLCYFHHFSIFFHDGRVAPDHVAERLELGKKLGSLFAADRIVDAEIIDEG